MIYYCIYRNKCKNNDCGLKVTETRESRFSERDLCTQGFFCVRNKGKYVLLTSAERLVCRHRLKCSSETCLIKTNYFTVESFPDKNRSIICPITNTRMNLITDGIIIKERKQTCLSIWK